MSTPSSEPCPEPLPYSDDISGYADIDFSVSPPSVFSSQATLVPVDTILSKQLGPTTNPVSQSASPYVYGFPILPEVTDDNAKPLLSSYAGSDISSPMTLSNGSPNGVSVNDLVNTPVVATTAPIAPVTTAPVAPVTTAPVTTAPVAPVAPSVQPFTNVDKPSMKKENFNNIDKNKNNLAKFINNTKPSVEHFKKPKIMEHFHQMTLMDNIVLGIAIFGFIYYIVSIKHGHIDIDLSKIPILAQLSDDNVSMENKIIIVLAIVVACVLISKMLK
jgi:hypothetical protein